MGEGKRRTPLVAAAMHMLTADVCSVAQPGFQVSAPGDWSFPQNCSINFPSFGRNLFVEGARDIDIYRSRDAEWSLTFK